MRAEDLSRGHWVVIALLVGGAIAWLQTNWGELGTVQTHGQQEFEQLLLRVPLKDQKSGKEYPWVTSIKVEPPMQAEYVVKKAAGGSYMPKKSLVAFKALNAAPGGLWQYKDATMLADDPYRPLSGQYGNVTHVQDFLRANLPNAPWIRFTYAWWREPMWSYTLWIAGCVVVIGGIWPTVQNRLILAGYGQRTDPNEKKESFFTRWFGGKRKAKESSDSDSISGSGGKANSRELSQDELDRIAQMEAGLQGFLQSSSEPGGEVADEPSAEPEIRRLDGGPLESQPQEEKPAEEKSYDGEFYPTVAHGKKKEE